MAPEWIYLLKVNVGIALFYAFYKLFCQRDTFFQWRRFALLSFLGISFIYPLFNIQHWIKEQPAMHELADYYANLMMEETVTLTTASATPQLPSALTLFIGIYFMGVGVLTLRFLIQLLSICRMRWTGKAMLLNGQHIISLSSEANPFSFFGWIFLYLPQLEKDSQEEILMHEQAHARQCHSVDVIVSEIINIICWFNPFSWLLKTEIRLNLEYLADNKVAETTHDCKQYQYHLLWLANTNRQTGLYNNFNVSHLKRRIIMMNKKRTRTTGRIKYALFVPLAVALLVVSNIEAVARNAWRVWEETVFQQENIHQTVDEMPEFPGGMMTCMQFLAQNIKYPPQAIDGNIEGRVIIQMVIKKDGTITDAKVVRSVHPLLDAEALRVVNLMPKWKPGKHKGEAVNVRFTLPVVFRLSAPKGEDGEATQKLQEASPAEAIGKKRPNNPDASGTYQVADVLPEFPGGMTACMQFLAKNIKYPADCMKKGIQGRVIIKFVVDKDGSIQDAQVARSIHPSLDKEALRVANLMPKWIPGKVNGQDVRCRFTIPIMFRLDNGAATDTSRK